MEDGYDFKNPALITFGIIFLIVSIVVVSAYLKIKEEQANEPICVLPITEEPTDNSLNEEHEEYKYATLITLNGHLMFIPLYSGSPYYELNNNTPYFKEDEIISEYYESYSGLDDFGRVQVAMACLSRDTMPLPYEKRESIGSIKPAGWQTAKYPGVVDGNYLYNRCHLIGWQLSAENANPFNLTTGTRYLNVEGMLPFENKVDEYIERTDHHVMYRVTPVFIEDELVCRGIVIEAQSVEDDNCVFCVYCYNVQPGIKIDYRTGESELDNNQATPTPGGTIVEIENGVEKDYVINIKTMKFHRPGCSSVSDISNDNIRGYRGLYNALINEGYIPCKKCNPD